MTYPQIKKSGQNHYLTLTCRYHAKFASFQVNYHTCSFLDTYHIYSIYSILWNEKPTHHYELEVDIDEPLNANY